MSLRILGCVLLLLSSSAAFAQEDCFSIVNNEFPPPPIVDGDDYTDFPCVRISGYGDIQGGRLPKTFFGGPSLVISGGEFIAGDFTQSGLFLTSGHTSISGGNFIRRRDATFLIGFPEISAMLDLHVLAFRATTFSSDKGTNYRRVQAWLENGEFLDAGFTYDEESQLTNYKISFIEHTGVIDADGDFDIDINDLNIVRNNFGSPGQGDLDGDGFVGMSDLNRVRNQFGNGFTLPASVSVPEPSSLTLTTLALASLAGIAWSHRCCRCHSVRSP